MDDYKRNEIQQAIAAADHALDCLYAAQRYLGSASGWGIVDMLGGGFLTTLIKRSKMSNASYCIQEAKAAMATFRRELADVDQAMPLAIDEGDFWTFADFFFDGFFADVMVQSQISRARSQVEDAIDYVSGLRQQLIELLKNQ